jgi:hypothetical protein
MSNKAANTNGSTPAERFPTLADLDAAVEAEEIHALVGAALFDHERRPHDRVAAFEQSRYRREHEQPARVGDKDDRRGRQQIAAVSSEKYPAPAEKIGEYPGGNHRKAVAGPIDRGELGDKKQIESDSEQIEVEEQAQQTHRQAAERAAQKQQAGIEAKAAEALADEGSSLRLTN